ncbi:HPP-domain-containing protein [Basidiobolus meristosporus CBS 931.73]|uniref:HPP-domain-containing protein n=1 Tax=Basidiobolus meristosporus CBS 931.73 TaxID=1314790 RepID=A0A1Y1Z506_9FUNG|nr:HPP-domain-containing protein [Basidiobolus meristosporus CBS 931.73]|eukprot:ORY05368.1 HPP-domain-containing protein [Basidiobolus meristosporus CBS 931.73]
MLGSYRGIFPKIPSIKVLVWSFIASFAGISLVAALSYNVDYFVTNHLPTIIGSFGASAVLIYGAVDSPLAQPRNFMGGHIISAFVGVSIGKICIATFNHPEDFLWLQGALAVSISIVLMQITRTVHPPGGATALIAVTSGQHILDLGYLYMAIPVLFGTALMLVVALVINNIQRQYPMYWRYPRKPDIIMRGDEDTESNESPGEMYEPKSMKASNSEKVQDYDPSKPVLKEATTPTTHSTYPRNTSFTVHIDAPNMDEARSLNHSQEVAEMYRRKYEEAQTYLRKLEQELELLRSNQARE